MKSIQTIIENIDGHGHESASSLYDAVKKKIEEAGYKNFYLIVFSDNTSSGGSSYVASYDVHKHSITLNGWTYKIFVFIGKQ